MKLVMKDAANKSMNVMAKHGHCFVCQLARGFTATSCNRTSTYIYSQDGNVQSIHIINLSPQTVTGNWKYTAEDKSSGVLEEFKDGKLVEKGNVKFLGKSQIQYTVTFSPNSDGIGKRYIWISNNTSEGFF